MRVCFIASNFAHTWATEVHVAHELQLLGHDVHKLHETVSLGQIEAACSEADAVFYMKARGLAPEASAMWKRLEARGVPCASYHLDLYYGLARQREIGVDPMWRTQYVFTADGDPAFQEYCDALDVNHRWMPAAVVSDEVGRGERKPQFRGDLCFVGTGANYPHPEWPFRAEMLRHLTAMYGTRFRAYTHADKMWDRDLNDLFASVKVVVGDSVCLPGHARYWSNRVPETIGRGGLLIAPLVPGIEEQFTSGRHLGAHFVGYEPGDLDSMFSAIEWALTNETKVVPSGITVNGNADIEKLPSLAEAIVDDGIEHVREHHTYRHRVLSMLETMGVN